jgi:hypothetical protein
MAGAEGDYWTQVVAGGSQEVVGEVPTNGVLKTAAEAE